MNTDNLFELESVGSLNSALKADTASASAPTQFTGEVLLSSLMETLGGRRKIATQLGASLQKRLDYLRREEALTLPTGLAVSGSVISETKVAEVSAEDFAQRGFDPLAFALNCAKNSLVDDEVAEKKLAALEGRPVRIPLALRVTYSPLYASDPLVGPIRFKVVQDYAIPDETLVLAAA